MKKALFLFFALALAIPAHAGVKISLWQPGENTRTHEAQIFFTLTKTKVGAFNIHSFNFSETVWSFRVTLRGAGDIFDRDHLSISDFDLRRIAQGLASKPGAVPPSAKIESGTVEVDRTRQKITIRLRLSRDGQQEDFVGNGTYDIPSARK